MHEPGDDDLGRSLAGRAIALTIGAAIAALVSTFVLYGISPHPTGWIDAAVGGAILVVGSVLAGRSLGAERTIRPVLVALIVPLFVAGPVFVLVAGFSNSGEEIPEAAAVALAIYALQTVPMLIVQRRHARAASSLVA
jgi:hypothetical protein